ncbi:HAD family hydrolase, partial [Streptomyces scabiei]
MAAVDLSLGRSVGILLDDRLAGIFITKDKVRADSKAALAELVKRGIKPVMLTGDNQKTAASVAEEV